MIENNWNNYEGLEVTETSSIEKRLKELDKPLQTEGMSKTEIAIRQNIELFQVEVGLEKLDTAQEKGNYGEIVTDVDMRSKGYERISKDAVVDIDQSGHHGIDGVYYKNDGHPQYVIVESKTGSAQLGEAQDGKQMSDQWIDNRLDEAVGERRADEIRSQKQRNPENVEEMLARVDEDGIEYTVI